MVDQVLLTTIELLGEVGYGALRIDDVASRSGVNKTTIYRRWPTKSQLVVAAAQRHHVYAPSPDTGDLVRDLTDMFVEQLSHVDVRLMRGLMRMTLVDQPDPELHVIREQTREAVLAMRLPRFKAAVKRGELPKKTDIVMLLSLISTTIYSRLLIHQEKPTPDLVSDIVTMMIEGARVKWARAGATKRR
ncbi:MAG: TetR/AcrR family transcriptional regulator [Kofleriaceae bacterium]